MHLQAIVVVALSIVQPFLCYEEPTDTKGNPILDYLKMDANHVEYEVVPVLHSVHNRSPKNSESPQVHFKAFGKSYQLSLKPTEGLFRSDKHVPMWAATNNDSNPNGVHYQAIADASTDVGDLYQDPTTMSSILLHHDDSGKVQVEGTVGSDLIIRSLPATVLKQAVDKTESLDRPDSLPDVNSRVRRGLQLTNHHVIIKRSNQSIDDQHSDYVLMESDDLAERFETKRSNDARSKRAAPRVVYPEILVFVDYETYILHGRNDAQIKRYFMVFWNGVDLRYKMLKHPEIRLSIIGIIISKTRQAMPYLEANRVDGDAVASSSALDAMAAHLFHERGLPDYDVAIAVTKLDMCSQKQGSYTCQRSTSGIANVGGACSVDGYNKKFYKVGMIEDAGGFGGIMSAAHEMAHLLGAHHDGDKPFAYLGGPGSQQCSWNDGYIMSYITKDENSWQWSRCSVASFRYFLNLDRANCLYNVPQNAEALPNVLPGKILSLDGQCQKIQGTNACDTEASVCLQLFCQDRDSDGCTSWGGAAEGSPCGDGMYCISGRCIPEHPNTIPRGGNSIPPYIHTNSVYGNGPRNMPPGYFNHPAWGRRY